MKYKNKISANLIIDENEVENILGSFDGNSIFKEKLNKSNKNNILEILMKYIDFNKLFGAGVANLSFKIASLTNVFIDNNEEFLVCRDRSMFIASLVFSAAIDEFGDTSLGKRPTHRMLAQAVIKGMINYFKLSSSKVSCLDSLENPEIGLEVCRGYGSNINDSDEGIFRALGFHIASEYLADQEFNMLDVIFRKKYPEIVNYLTENSVDISGFSVPAYHWIKIHTSVEEDHFENSLKAANLALKYYSGTKDKESMKHQIILGMKHFARFQEEFMKSL